MQKKYEVRQRTAKVEPALEEQFQTGRLLGMLKYNLFGLVLKYLFGLLLSHLDFTQYSCFFLQFEADF